MDNCDKMAKIDWDLYNFIVYDHDFGKNWFYYDGQIADYNDFDKNENY